MKPVKTSTHFKNETQKRFFFSRFTRYFPLFFLLALYLFISISLLLKDPPVWPDESFFINMSEHLQNDGVLRMTLYGEYGSGMPHVRAYSYPPFYFYILRGWIQFFGSTIQSIRLLSVIAGSGVLFLFFNIIYKLTKSTAIAVMSTVCFMFLTPVSIATRVARMDIFVLLGIMGSFYYFLRFQESKAVKSIFFSGISGTIAALFHPIGLFSLLFLLFISIYEYLNPKMVRLLLLFIIPYCIGFILLLFLFSDHLDLFYQQMVIQFVYKQGRESLLNLLFQNDITWRVLLLSHIGIGLLAIFLGFLKNNKLLLISGLGTFASIIFCIQAVDQWYFLFLPIFPFFTSAICIQERQKTHYKILPFIPLAILAITYGSVTIPGIYSHLQKNENYQTFSNGISNQIPQGSNVLLSSVPDPYFVLRNRPDLTIYQAPHVMDERKYTELLKTIDIVVSNYATNQTLTNYISSHMKKKIIVQQENGYQADVVFLK